MSRGPPDAASGSDPAALSWFGGDRNFITIPSDRVLPFAFLALLFSA